MNMSMWLQNEMAEELKEFTSGNKGAAAAVGALLSTPEGADCLRRYLEFPKISISPDELWIIYNDCCQKDLRLFASTMDLLADLEPGMVHANLRKKHPIKFVEFPVNLPANGKDRQKCISIIKGNFEKRYRMEEQ